MFSTHYRIRLIRTGADSSMMSSGCVFARAAPQLLRRHRGDGADFSPCLVIRQSRIQATLRSRILISSGGVTIRFSDFTSRCANPAAWTSRNPSATWAAMRSCSASPHSRSGCSRPPRSIRAAYLSLSGSFPVGFAATRPLVRPSGTPPRPTAFSPLPGGASCGMRVSAALIMAAAVSS